MIAINNCAFSVRIHIIFLFPSFSLWPLSVISLLVSSLRGGRAIDLCGVQRASHPMLLDTAIAGSFWGVWCFGEEASTCIFLLHDRRSPPVVERLDYSQPRANCGL